MSAIVLAFTGIALMIGLSGIGSCYGVTISGKEAVRAMTINSDGFGSYLIMSALPSTQGLYGFLGYFLMAEYLVPDISMFHAASIFAAGTALGAISLWSAFRKGRVCASGIIGVAEGHDVFGRTVVLAVFAELYPIVALAATFLIAGSLGG